MSYKLQFEIHKDSGNFTYTYDNNSHLCDEFDNILDAHAYGEISDKRYIAELNRFIKLEPDFIDVYAHLSFVFLEQDKPQKALNIALTGLAQSNRLIPDSFSGMIKWLHIENRPYLRTLQGAILAYVRLRRHKDAVALIDKMLAYNPNDNHGCRYLLGSEVLRLGNKERAEKIFEKYRDRYPPYCYELALLHILNKDWVKASTALRRGFSKNSYIAEILCGNYRPEPLAICHGNNFAEPEMANDYIETYGKLWFRNPEALVFTRWLFNHSSILAERAALMKCSEDLFNEDDYDIRHHVIEHQNRLRNEIDHRLSMEIIKKVTTRRGEEVWPWVRTR